MRPKSAIYGLRTERPLLREFFAEFMGTLILIAIGDAGIASYVLKKGTPDTFAICFCYGVGVLVGVSCSIHVSGAHLNPAVTVALASVGKFPVKKIAHYVLAQFLGGFFGAAIVYFTYFEGIAWLNQQEDPLKTAGIFATYPASHGLTIWGALTDQIIGTAILLFCVSAITDTKGVNTPRHLIPMVLSFLITAICVAYGLNCGAILNPARDVSPRLFTALLGWRGVFAPLNGHYWWLVAIVGPLLGGPIGAWIYYLTIELHNSDAVEPSLPYADPHESNSLFTGDRDMKDDKMFHTIGSALNGDSSEPQEPTNRVKLTRIPLE